MKKAIINRDNLDKKYIITHNEDINGHELLKYIQQYSLLINNQNITKVGIFSENRVEWVYALYAALQSNCIAVPIDYMASAEDVAYIIDDCKPEILFISAAMTETYTKVRQKKALLNPKLSSLKIILPFPIKMKVHGSDLMTTIQLL